MRFSGEMFCSCRNSTDKCLARSLCNSRVSCFCTAETGKKLQNRVCIYLFSPLAKLINLDLFFRYLKGRYHGNQFCWKNCKLFWFVALAFRNGMAYRYQNVRINSAIDACISCENFVKFGPVTPELTELICERLVRQGQKTGVFSRISTDIRDRFLQSFYNMKVHYVQMMDLYLIFQFVKVSCHDNQIMQP